MHIVFFNRLFLGRWVEVDAEVPGVTFTYGPELLYDADAVVFHLPTLDLRQFLRLRKRRGQLWVGFTMESPVMHPREHRWWLQRRFDLTMNYERSADVWMPYLDRDIASLAQRPVPAKTAPAPAVWMVSNADDRAERCAYADELGRYVQIDRFGKVNPNQTQTVPTGKQGEYYARYKFTLAFENSFAPDYVTEKFWSPLAAGSVPVYRGTADIAALAPDPQSYIDARDFGSPQELAHHLAHLDCHEDEYAELHAWRERPLSSSFAALVERVRTPWAERLVAALLRTSR